MKKLHWFNTILFALAFGLFVCLAMWLIIGGTVAHQNVFLWQHQCWAMGIGMVSLLTLGLIGNQLES